VMDAFVAKIVLHLLTAGIVCVRRHCECINSEIVCDGDHDMEEGSNETDSGVDVAEARADEVDDLLKQCSCNVNGTLVCDDDEHAHTDEAGLCHCDGYDVHCEDEALEAECLCLDNEEVQCGEHDGEEHAEEDCHCDADAVHCVDEALEAECHCDDGVLQCEAHEGEEHADEDCHCDGASIHCVDEALEAECHCDDGDLQCEAQEEGT
jgi:hypothetical protein